MPTLDADWIGGDSAESAPTYRLVGRSEPYLIRIGTKWVRIEVPASEPDPVVAEPLVAEVDAAPMRIAANKPVT